MQYTPTNIILDLAVLNRFGKESTTFVIKPSTATNWNSIMHTLLKLVTIIKCIVRESFVYNYDHVIKISNSNMTSFKRFESKPVVKIILIYDRLHLWRHRQFIAIFYQFLHIRIEIIHGRHMYILFLPPIGLYVSFLPRADTRGKTSWHKGLPVVKTIYAYGFHELFLKWFIGISTSSCDIFILTLTE
jgi:hypothetical protein